MDLERNSLGLGISPALIVVDMIKGFTDPACALGSDCPEVVAANASLLQAFHARGLPVYFTRVVYHRADQARVFRNRIQALNVLTPDSRWVQLDDRLEVGAGDEIIDKQWASAFHQTDLDRRLRERGVDSVVVTGLTTSGCVRATAVDGLQHDYRVVVARDLVRGTNDEMEQAALKMMSLHMALVMDSGDILSTWDARGAKPAQAAE